MLCFCFFNHLNTHTIHTLRPHLADMMHIPHVTRTVHTAHTDTYCTYWYILHILYIHTMHTLRTEDANTCIQYIPWRPSSQRNRLWSLQFVITFVPFSGTSSTVWAYRYYRQAFDTRDTNRRICGCAFQGRGVQWNWCCLGILANCMEVSTTHIALKVGMWQS